MEGLEKLRILLQHWIDHNEGHTAEYEKWQHVAAHEGTKALAENIAGAIAEMTQANDFLRKALAEVGGPVTDGGGHHHHHHHH